MGDGDGWSGEGKQGHDGFSGVATHDRNGELGGGGVVEDGSGKLLGAHHVEGGDAKQLFGVEDVVLFENLGGDGDCRVDGVGDDEDERGRAEAGHAFDNVPNDSGVDGKQVVSGHAGFSGDTGGDDDDIGASESGLETAIGRQVAHHGTGGGNVRKISGDTGTVDDIVEGQIVHQGRQFQEQRKRLPNSSGSTSDDSFDHGCLLLLLSNVDEREGEIVVELDKTDEQKES